MSNPDNNNQSVNTGASASQPPKESKATFKEKWKEFRKFCAVNTKKLLGSMASGAMLGLFFALFLSLFFTPIMFKAFNSCILDYESFFKPQQESLRDDQKIVKGADNKKEYRFERVENAQNQYCYTVSTRKDGEPNDRCLYTVILSKESDRAKGIQKKLTINIAKGDATDSDDKKPDDNDKKSAADAQEPAANAQEPAADAQEPVQEPVQEPAADAQESAADAQEPAADTQESAADAQEPVADDKEPDADDKEPNADDKEPIPWYETSNIAHDNSVFEIASSYLVLKSPSYPTSITAFISWLKEYGAEKKYLDLSIGNDNEIIASHLERILEEDWKFQKKNDIRLLFFRSVNGEIQFLCVVLFNAILILLIARNIVILYNSPLHRRFKEKVKEEKITTDLNACDKRMVEYVNIWDIESPMLAIWRSALSQKMRESPSVSLTEITERIKNSMQSSFAYVSFLADTIPALGFVGTIIGIGKTMLNTSAVISNEIGKQQSRISDVSLDLAFAFDTTLVALLLSMVIGFFITVEMRQEEKHILDIVEDITNQNLNNDKESK